MRTRYRMPDAGCKMPDTRCKMQDTRCRMQDAGFRIADGLSDLSFWIIVQLEYKKMQNNTGRFHYHEGED